MTSAATNLEEQILAAHANGDGLALSELYFQAAGVKKMAGETEASAFLLTQAYVFALESGHPIAMQAHAELVALGLAKASEIKYGLVVRQSKAYPVYD